MSRIGLLLPLLLALPCFGQSLEEAIQNRMERGKACMESKDYEGAVHEFERAIALDAEYAPAYQGRADAHYAKKDWEQATADYTKAIELGAETAAHCHHRRGLILQFQQKHEEAIADFDVVMETYPNWAPVWLARGFSRHQLVDYAGADADYARAMELDPKRHEAYMRRATVREDMGDWEAADQVYSEVIGLFPTWAEAWRARARARAYLGNREGSDEDFAKAIELAPEDSRNLSERARMRMIAGEYEKAVDDCKEAARLAPKSEYPFFILGLVHFNFGNFRQARIEFLKASRRASYEPDYIQLYLCLTQIRLKKGDRARADLQAYYDAKKDDPSAWYTQIVKFLTGKIPEDEFVASAKDETPKLTRERRCEACFYAGALRKFSGDDKGARELFQQCVDTGVRHFIEYETSFIELRRK